MLVEDPDNPGTDNLTSDLDDLVQDIRGRGVPQPIIVVAESADQDPTRATSAS